MSSYERKEKKIESKTIKYGLIEIYILLLDLIICIMNIKSIKYFIGDNMTFDLRSGVIWECLSKAHFY